MPKLVKPVEGNANGEDPNTAIKMRTPTRILHFSDGILEEYSDDEVDDAPQNQEQRQEVVDPSTLTWGPWFWYKTWRAGTGTLAVVDCIGEYLASFLGITTPKYYFELEEYKKNNAKAQEQKEQQAGWTSGGAPIELNDIKTNQPKPVEV